MGTVICVASGKGGTGKTSLTSGIACCLAALDKKVIVLDADVGLRNLDLVLGLADRAIFDFGDVLAQRTDLGKALTQHPLIPNLSLLAAPLGAQIEPIEPQRVAELIRQLKQEFDYCIIDCPAGLGFGFQLAVQAADRAIVVCTPDASSLRDAQLTRRAMLDAGVSDIRLVVNRIRPKLIAKMHAANIDEAIDQTGIQLIGIVPEDANVIACANRGELVFSKMRTPAAKAYRNIARRILGEAIPLMKIKK